MTNDKTIALITFAIWLAGFACGMIVAVVVFS
jgi:tetrahydromethanopterin S-methyltransferase subunit F